MLMKVSSPFGDFYQDISVKKPLVGNVQGPYPVSDKKEKKEAEQKKKKKKNSNGEEKEPSNRDTFTRSVQTSSFPTYTNKGTFKDDVPSISFKA